jgi:CyaY protein
MPLPESDQAFLHRAERLVNGIVSVLDRCDPDELEAEVAQGVVKIAFADGSRCILNRQSAARQIWLAEGATAWHFAFDEADQRWIDTKGRGELLSILAGIVCRKLGRPFRFEG